MYYDQLSDLGIKLRRRSGQEKTTCPQCSESRRNKKDTSLSVNITEGTYNCHHCSWKGSVKQFQQKEMKKKFEKPDQSMLKSISLNEKVVAYSKARGISEETLKRFMIHAKEEWMPQTQKKERCIVFPYIRSGELINAKFRDGAKNFRLCKDAEMTFFGMQTLDGKHCAIITEGEWDALAAYEAGFGKNYETVADKDGVVVEHDLGRWAVLSVPNGASMGSQKLEYLDNCSDWLSSIDEFVIATDGDEAGISLRDELVRRLGVEKCRILHYPSDAVISNTDGSKRACKDLNEVLLVFGKDALISLVNESDALPVDGITYLGDIFPTMLENFRNGVKLSPTTRFGDFDEYFRWKKGDINVVIGYGNHGKALALDTEIPTPIGWTTMGKLKIGDKIFDENGNICNVTNATNVMYDRECYEITFSDGTKIVADGEHLWETHTINSRISIKNKIKNLSKKNKKINKNNQEYKRILSKVRTTKEILETLEVKRKNGKIFKNHSINLSLPLQLDIKKFIIEPYLLGVWIGDGTSASGQITCNDIEIIEEIERLGYTCIKQKARFMYGIKGIQVKLKELGVLNNKHIPIEYLRGSEFQRMELLKGLMDTDGSIDKTSICEFTTIKKHLSEQVYELIASLGFKAVVYECDAMLNGKFISKKYRVCFKPFNPVFKLKRKLERHTNTVKCKYRYINEINKIKSVPVRCITVDSPNNLYLVTKSFIPTHNTTFWLQMMLTKSIYDGWKWAIFSPENYPANDFYDDLVEMYAGKWLDKMDEKEYVEACGFVNDHIFYVYPENEHDIESIHEKFRYLILKKGCDGVMIDPFNQLDKVQKPYERDDQYIGNVLKDIKRFALLNAVSYNIVMHPKNPSYNSDKSLPVVDMYDIAGGAMTGNKSDQIISYYRPNFHLDKNDPNVQVHIQKLKRRRTGGKLGQFEIKLNWSTKRYSDMFDHTYCDPERAKRILFQENNGILQNPQQQELTDETPF